MLMVMWNMVLHNITKHLHDGLSTKKEVAIKKVLVITLFIFITLFCGSDNILQNNSYI